ncbi:hypothetical protein BO83DRAFT_424916 [Aspergillus eucalypticola CBS 122712]|uniref:Zn(2)-C6 fungal-type domain-containing protein n=1 Tax=Aspergillus eucalypticola (strain CBS 122712 / IBT 29274) TaxID=1448314 RepID=A0A317W1E1_ASPEC|nr:uncharacterized protein BO83DRAFT_424916 [Aspergillus eucalypticola CBS 122712]PWY78988.1 hypothetical protein BO83DRAFT_424916 [Aspergillus eucalypticola CBS 122712]
MHPIGRKRRVTTCVPCYTRKQRCNRQYPCNHCTRRRRPEECVYHSIITGDSSNSLLLKPTRDGEPQEPPNIHLSHGSPKASPAETQNSSSNSRSALARSFGYFEHSDSNTMALLKKWDLDGEGDTDKSTQGMSSEVLQKYFVDELNWMKQIIHPPSFLIQYQQWWTKEWPLSVEDIELAALILWIGAYSAQFLPSPTHTLDRILGLSLSDIRDTCSNLGGGLARACLSWHGYDHAAGNVAQIGATVICLVVASQVFQSTAVHNLNAVLDGRGYREADIRNAMAGVQSTLLKSLSGELRERAIKAITDAMARAFIIPLVAGAVGVVSSLGMRRERLFV